MAGTRSAKSSASNPAKSAANVGFEAKLWLAADKLPSNMDAAECKHAVLRISGSQSAFHHLLTIGKPRLTKGADIQTFAVLNCGFSGGKERVCRERAHLPRANPDAFRVLGPRYDAGGNRVYYLNSRIPLADTLTFQVGPAQLHGADRNRTFDRWESL